jgi:hypothetical protein
MTIETMKRLFIETLSTQGGLYVSGYEEAHEKIIVVKVYGQNIEEIEICVGFDIMLGGAILISIGYYELPNFSGNREAGIHACNEVNSIIRGKCFIDDEDDAVMTTVIPFDAYGVHSEFCPEQVLLAALDMAVDADKAYPIITSAARQA